MKTKLKMKIALIAGEKGVKRVGSGVNYTIIRLHDYLIKEHQVKLIYGNQTLPKPLGRLPLGEIEGYDVIHAGTAAYAAFISSSVPILATFYDDIMCKPSIYLREIEKRIDRILLRVNKEASRLLIKRGLQKCKKIVAISEEAKGGAIESFSVPENKIVCIPPGIDTDVFKPLNIQKENKNKLKLFFCGGIGYRKGVDVLLESLQILKRKIPVELWLAGSIHPFFPLTQILRNLDLVNEVKCFGFVSDDKLNQLYNKADIFVFPSIGEGYGIPPLESLYCGTKVVCSQIPSIREFTNFITITETNPKSIVDNVLKTIDKEVDFKLVQKMIQKDYSVKATSEKYIKVYQELISK